MYVIVEKATLKVTGTQSVHPGDTVNDELFDVFLVPPAYNEGDFWGDDGEPITLTQEQYDALAEYNLQHLEAEDEAKLQIIKDFYDLSPSIVLGRISDMDLSALPTATQNELRFLLRALYAACKVYYERKI